MLLEMHCHTSDYSTCSHIKALDLIAMMVRKGLQGLVITDHHHLWKEEELRNLARLAGVPEYFVVLSGQEVFTADMGDVLVYGADKTITKGTPLPRIRSQFPAAALVFAHPYRNGRVPDDRDLTNPAFDGIEIFSSNHSVSENARGLRDWHRLRFTALAGTDTHAGSYAGLYPTLFDHPVETVEELAREIASGRCRPLVKEIPKEGANTRVEEITIGTKGEDKSRERIIIKTLRDTSKWLRAERSFYIVEELARHGFNEGPYRIAKFIDGDHENKVLIEQGLQGNSLFEKMIRSTAEERRDFIRLSAQWLAKLHNLRLHVTAPGEFLETESRHLARYVDGFAAEHHTYTRRIAEITEAVGSGRPPSMSARRRTSFKATGITIRKTSTSDRTMSAGPRRFTWRLSISTAPTAFPLPSTWASLSRSTGTSFRITRRSSLRLLRSFFSKPIWPRHTSDLPISPFRWSCSAPARG